MKKETIEYFCDLCGIPFEADLNGTQGRVGYRLSVVDERYHDLTPSNGLYYTVQADICNRCLKKAVPVRNIGANDLTLLTL